MQTTKEKKPEPPMPPLAAVLARLGPGGGQDALYDREEPVQVFSGGAGLGKSYAGFRITFRIKDGEKRFNKFTTLEKGGIFPKREEPSAAERSRFLSDVNAEAAGNAAIRRLIETHDELRL